MKKINRAVALLIVGNLFLIHPLFSQNVNQFTGNFSYSVPLITVPSPYGPPVTIGAAYNAGIGVNQSSSELGLGWDLNAAGAISRSVSGIPDDWNNVTVADQQNFGFKTQCGVMNLKNDVSSINLDFNRSILTDTTFYFPDYDSYFVSGAGINGFIQPHLFDFATTELDSALNFGVSTTNVVPYTMTITNGGFNKTMQFNFVGDYGGNFKSRHYPTTPIDGSTTLRYPSYHDTITDAEQTSTTTPYIGVGSGSTDFSLTTNRLATAKYITYSKGSDSSITGFTITDESGYQYIYNLPVHIYSATFGRYPLDNNYTIKNYAATDTVRHTDGSGNYYIKDSTNTFLTPDANHPYILEWKQNATYVSNWLLTEVRGPDYVDANASGHADNGDKGYWVFYSWKNWTNNFVKRSPEYGFDYSFSPDENEKSQDVNVVNSANKISGKYATFSKYVQDAFYLNAVQTSSHTAILVRDVKLDGFSSEPYNYDNQASSTSNMPAGSGTATKTTSYGTLYDDGTGTPPGYCGSNISSVVTIAPTGATSINVRFNSFAMGTTDTVRILNPSNGILATYTGSSLPANATYNFSSIKVKENTHTGTHLAGFRLGWSSVHPTVIPALKITKVVLFTNNDYTALITAHPITNLTTSVSGFDISAAGKGNFFNETWYQTNKTAIEAKSLQTTELSQDYSLSKKYISNVKTIVTATDKFSNQSDVVKGMYTASADTASSGKLTLNEITTYNVAHVKTAPSVVFDYHNTIYADNPDYNPVKIDYAGFYKNDASAQGYSAYTTDTSKNYTDAWSLRKITSPLGGTVEINYESNQYEKVLDGAGGSKGPSKTYALNSVSSPSSDGATWNYVLEENTTTPLDFTELKTSPPAGTVKHVFIPYVDTVADNKFISQDTFNFSGSNQVTAIQNVLYTNPINSTNYTNGGDPGSLSTLTNLRYTGNGYIHFDLPVGTAVYGGGIRVKSLVFKNGTTDSYTQEYTYSGGVTQMEFDRFAPEKTMKWNFYHPDLKLRAPGDNKYQKGPGIGYTTVTVKNKGQNNIANGSSITTFITSDAGIDNLKTTVQMRTATSPPNHCVTGVNCCTGFTDTAYMVEVINKFNGYWGQVQQLQSLDINGTILSSTKNEYINLTTQGATTENYDFVRKVRNLGFLVECDQYHHYICIKRDYPVVLSKQTTYAQGISSVTEYVRFDPVTMAPVETRTTAPNKGIKVSRTSPAFRIPQYAAMGPKSVTSTNANILACPAFARVTTDSTITHTSDFSSYAVQTFKKNFNIRMYSVNRSKYIDSAQTNKYWISDMDYNWVGDSASIDHYGLYKQSNFVAFDYTLASINKKWMLGTQSTLLDSSGHVLEYKMFNNRFRAKKYGYGDTMQIAEASNVNYSSFTYSGFESAVNDHDPGAGVANYIDGEIKMNSAVKLSGTALIPAHTGTYLLKVPSGTTGASSPTYSVKYNSTNENEALLKGRTYRASVWVDSVSPGTCKLSASFAGGTAVSITKSASTVTIGRWTLLNLDITVSSTPTNGDELKVYLESSSGDAYFDDLRVHPVDATMSATVYEPRTNRVVATLDANNFATIYTYDAGGEVLEVWQEIEGVGLKRMKKYQRNYARGL